MEKACLENNGGKWQEAWIILVTKCETQIRFCLQWHLSAATRHAGTPEWLSAWKDPNQLGCAEMEIGI